MRNRKILEVEVDHDPLVEGSVQRVAACRDGTILGEDYVLDEATDEEGISSLRRVASLELPSSDEVIEVAATLREASAAMEEAEEAFEEQDGRVIEILKKGLSFHEHQDEETCPLCGTQGALTETWRKEASERIEAVEAASKARRDGRKALDSTLKKAERLLGRVPMPPELSLDSFEASIEARNAWMDAPKEAVNLAEHLEEQFGHVESSYESLREEANEELRSLQAEWRPIRRAIEAFIEAEERWREAKAKIKSLKKSEDWLKATGAELRNLRFAPIREEAQQIWETLRHRSNVSLNDIRLEGTRTSRRVELEVAVDGEDAVALGVMSQGELHSMLLSLFLPRLTLDESPFRFLVVDDPVQAMDPAKVDGLARVLADVAERRQVIVFTHDARLPEALRRMQIPARIVEVSRGENSAVSLRDTRSRTEQFISDAFQVADNQNKYGPRVAPDVVPGLCRGALEAHFQSVVWNTLLKDGKTHDEIEAEIANANGVHPLAALAIFGDTSRSGDVYGYLNQKATNGTDTFIALKEGSHGGFKGDVRQLIHDTRTLLRGLGASV